MTLTVQPTLNFIQPRLDRRVVHLVHWGLPLWLRWTQGIEAVELQNGLRLAQLMGQFQQGQIRLLLAFRHPTTADPPCLIQALGHLVPRIAQEHGIPLRPPIHAHFMYDRGIPLWAGNLAGWLLPRLGGTPINRGKVDRPGLKSARAILLDGSLPLAAAPEGGANGHGDILTPLEPGMAQLGFWCQEDLHKAHRSQQVIILPIHVDYCYSRDPSRAMAQLLTQLERDCGLSSPRQPTVSLEAFSQRLSALGDYLLPQMERFYEQFFPTPLTTALETTPDQPGHEPGILPRLHRLLDTALRVAEFNFNVTGKGTLMDRRHRIEQAAWDRIYRLDQDSSLTPLSEGLANRIAQEASLHLWHMRLVETFIATATPRPLGSAPHLTWERLGESILRFWAVITRLKGQDPLRQPAPRLGSRRATLVVGDPLSVTERWPAYEQNRRAAVQQLTADLQTALENLMTSQTG